MLFLLNYIYSRYLLNHKVTVSFYFVFRCSLNCDAKYAVKLKSDWSALCTDCASGEDISYSWFMEIRESNTWVDVENFHSLLETGRKWDNISESLESFKVHYIIILLWTFRFIMKTKIRLDTLIVRHNYFWYLLISIQRN
jgi:hypothetical protein